MLKVGNILKFDDKDFKIKYLKDNFALATSAVEGKEDLSNTMFFDISDENNIKKVKNEDTLQKVIYEMFLSTFKK